MSQPIGLLTTQRKGRGWRDVHHIVNSSVNGTPYHTIFQNEKANFCRKTRKSYIFLEFTCFQKKKRKNGIPKRECKFLPQDRPPKRIAFFWNLRLEATFFFLWDLHREATFFVMLPPYTLICMNQKSMAAPCL